VHGLTLYRRIRVTGKYSVSRKMEHFVFILYIMYIINMLKANGHYSIINQKMFNIFALHYLKLVVYETPVKS